LEVLIDSSRHALLDPVTGVSATTMLGQRGHFGTNYFNVLLNPDMIRSAPLMKPATEVPTEVNALMSFMQTSSAENKNGCQATAIANMVHRVPQKQMDLCMDDYSAVPF